MRWILVMAGGTLLAACNTDVSVTDSPKCDGKLQPGEDVVDGPFDADGDGYVDATNPACQTNYAAEDLDCDDHEATVHPGAAEVACDLLDNDCDEATVDAVDLDQDGANSCDDCADDDPDVSPLKSELTCNGVDDDCDAATPDAVDADGDGVSACDDCDDNQAAATPGKDEVCDDSIDNDCDGQVDEDCNVDYSGTYTLDQTVKYSCAYGSVKINFSQLTVTDLDPTVYFKASGSQPGTMTGTRTMTTFYADHVLSGTCDETYTISGTWTDVDHFTFDFSAEYSGGACYDCKNQYWTGVVASK